MINTRQASIAKKGNISLESGQFAWLDSKDAILQITQGSAEVYAVKNFDNWRQRKIFLFDAPTGSSLFCLPPEEAPDLRLMLVAPKGASLRVMSKTDLLAFGASGGEQTIEPLRFMLEEWLELLLSTLIFEAAPLNFIPITGGETVTLEKHQIVRSRKSLTWARLEEGSVYYGSMPEYEAEVKAVLPLVGSSWLVAKEASVLTGLSSEQIFPASLTGNPAVFWQPLSECHKLVGMIINQYFALTTIKNQTRLKEQQTQQNKLLQGATAHLLKSQTGLSSVIGADTSSPMVAAVKIVASYLGIPEEEVRLPTGMNPKRQDFFMLKSITRLIGLQIREVKLEKGWHFRDIGPVLGAFGPEENLAVFIPVSPQKYLMHTPDGLHMEVTADLASEISETAYVFYAPIRGTNISTTGLFKFMLQKCWKKDIWTLIATSLAAGLIAIITPLVTKTVFEDIIPMYDRQGHLMVVQVMVVAAFSAAGVGFVRNIAIVRLRSRSLLSIESALWLRLLSLPVGFFRNYQTGDVVQRMQGITGISTLLATSSIAAVFNLVFSFSSLLIMMYYSWKLSLVALLAWSAYLMLAGLLLWHLVYLSRCTEEASGQTAGKVLQLFNGLSKFRIKKAESQAFYLWAHKFGEQWHFNYNTQWKISFLKLLNLVQPPLMSMLIFFLTIYFLQQSADNSAFITLPDFMGFHSALGGLNVTIVGLVNILSTLPKLIPLVQRIKPLLEAEPETTVNKSDPGELSGQIEVNNVSFRYSSEKPLTLKNVSLVARPGQFLAIVGASGSGKSTLLRLLLGFEKPENGSIYYDGQDIKELNLNLVRSQMGVVLQNGQLMSGEIYKNIIGALPLNIEDAWAAAEMVGIADDIRRMPMGMHTIISEGASNISGGQRQRILIARAIVHRPRIILFDEATSALDNKTQSIVSESISGLNATRIVVAHRLSTIINADTIYVLEKGQVAEIGNYTELMNKNGHFAALARRQMF